MPQSDELLQNWHPDPAVISWALNMVDLADWSPDDRKAINLKFVPSSVYAHLFDAVHMPPDLLSCLKNKSSIASDYLFNRFSAETFFYNCNLDLVTAYKPLLQVLSNLKDIPGQKDNRFLLGRVFQGMVSATIKLSRGRRELVRKFVPLANATAFFSKFFNDINFSCCKILLPGPGGSYVLLLQELSLLMLAFLVAPPLTRL